MAKALYSPRLKRDLISPLYHAAKARGTPMTEHARVTSQHTTLVTPKHSRFPLPLPIEVLSVTDGICYFQRDEYASPKLKRN